MAKVIDPPECKDKSQVSYGCTPRKQTNNDTLEDFCVSRSPVCMMVTWSDLLYSKFPSIWTTARPLNCMLVKGQPEDFRDQEMQVILLILPMTLPP